MSAVSASATEIPAAGRSTVGYLRVTSLAFWGVHLAALIGVIALGWSWSGAALALGSYFVRMIVVTAGYHRYFAHRAFKTSRAFQFLLALGAQSAAQKGVLWWAATTAGTTSTRTRRATSTRRSCAGSGTRTSAGSWARAGTRPITRMVADLAKYPELRALDRYIVHILPTVALALAFLFLGGVHALVWGYFVSTVLLWHGSFTINSLAHLFGKRRYATSDDSRNNWSLALLTTGEGWHNNHHHYQSSANQGFRWWEIDVTYYVLRAARAHAGLIWDLRRPPREVIADAADAAA